MIEWIVTSSALILLVILLQVLIKGRVNPRLRYALWGLVLLRLLIPGTLWESRASVMTPVAAQEEYQAVERIPRYVRTQPDGWVEIGHPAGGNWTSVPPEAEAVRTDKPAAYQWFDPEEAVSLTELRRQVNIRDALLLVWLAGAAAVGVFLLVVNLRFCHKLKKKRRTLEQYRDRWVFAVEGLASPCLFGMFRPAIYLTPEVAVDETAKAHVLAHEYVHFRQGDHIWAVLRGVCLAVHWYNPLVWLAAYLSRRDCELSCDEGAVRLLGEDHRADYGRTLVGLVARRTTPGDLACCATTMTGGKSALKERVALLVKRPRTTAWMACVVAAACIVFAVCTFTGAAKAEKPDEAEPAQTEREPAEEMPEDLPTRVVSPGTPEAEADIWLAAELPEDDIAVYYEEETGRSWLRYGKSLQELEMGDREPMTPRKLLPELYFRDLDGDGEKELAMIYNSDSGTGVSIWSLTVLEWDGENWSAYTALVDQDILVDFNENRRVTFYPEVVATAVRYKGQNVVVDMDAMFDRSVWADKMPVAEITGLFSEYRMEDTGLTLTLTGEVRPEGYAPTTSYAFTYTCPVSYDNGAFYAGGGQLESLYPTPVAPRPDASRLTFTFRDILRQFIDECRSEGTENLSTENFAICDVNGDGKDELITQTNYAMMAGQVEMVYDEDGNELLAEYPLVTYYDNGYAVAGWSHNQGVAGNKLWPYTLLRYDADAGRYVRVAAVDGWDKSIRDAYLSDDETAIPFPDGVDKDEDGFVYYIIEEEGGYAPVYGQPVDYAEYTQWAAQYLEANVVHVSRHSFSEQNIALIEQNAG